MKHTINVSMQRRYLNLGLSLGSIIFGFALWYYLGTTSWAKADNSAINNPGFFPNLVAKGIIVVGVALLIRCMIDFHDREKVSINVWSLLILVLWWIYVMVMPYLGFILASILVVAISMIIWGVKKKRTIVICSIAVPVILYLILGVGLNVRFPTLFL